MTDTTTKQQVIEGTLEGMDEIGEYSQKMRDYVRRRLERAYDLGYQHGLDQANRDWEADIP